MELSREARLIAAEVGAVVLIALAVVAVPRIVASWGKPAALRPTLTVVTLRSVAVAGVIGRGTINGKGWQVQLMPGQSWRGASQCAPADHLAVDCQLGYTYLWERRFPDKAEPAFLNGSRGMLVGQVRPNVSSVKVRLSNRTVVQLRPVEAYGRRWIGLVFPDVLSVAMVTVYGDGSTDGAELAHAVPWRGEFYTWLPPGDPGPRAVTKAINRAVVPWATLQVGPWGNCVVGASGWSCFPLGDRDYATWVWDSGDAPYTPRELIVPVSPDVVSVLVTLTDGRTVRVPVARGAGIGFFAVKVLAQPGIMLWGAYDAAGHRVSGGIGAPDTAPGV